MPEPVDLRGHWMQHGCDILHCEIVRLEYGDLSACNSCLDLCITCPFGNTLESQSMGICGIASEDDPLCDLCWAASKGRAAAICSQVNVMLVALLNAQPDVKHSLH